MDTFETSAAASYAAIAKFAARQNYKPVLTPIEYAVAALRESKSRCALCHEPGGGPLRCDHDHGTGRFRGWICDRCNRRVVDCPSQTIVQAKLVKEYIRRSIKYPIVQPVPFPARKSKLLTTGKWQEPYHLRDPDPVLDSERWRLREFMQKGATPFEAVTLLLDGRWAQKGEFAALLAAAKEESA